MPILLNMQKNAEKLGHLHNHVGLSENFDQSENEEFLVNDSCPKVDYYWRDGTFDALEELRTKELYHRTYGNGRGL